MKEEFQTAIAGSIDLRTYVSLFTSADGRIYLSLPDLQVERTWMLKDLLKAGERLAGRRIPCSMLTHHSTVQPSIRWMTARPLWRLSFRLPANSPAPARINAAFNTWPFWPSGICSLGLFKENGECWPFARGAGHNV
jgi:hypothetical protein